MGRLERKSIIAQIEEKRKSKVFCLLTSDRPNFATKLQKDVLPRFANQLRRENNYKSIDLFIFTHGGDTLAGFGLSRLLREWSDRVNLLVPDCCHSAGTLLGLGCNEIVMTKAATLSPIDPSIEGPLNPAIKINPALPPQIIPLSVESVAGFKALVNSEWKVTNQKNVSDILKILADKVHPIALGDVFRSRQQIELLASELLKQHRKDHRRIKEIIRILSKDLGSHDYLIYRSEAKKILGDQIHIDDDLEVLIWNLYLDFIQEMQLGIPFDPNLILTSQPQIGQQPQQPQSIRTVRTEIKMVMIESFQSGDQALKRVDITETLNVQPNGMTNRQIGLNEVFSGWECYT